MLKAGYGRIVNIASISGKDGQRQQKQMVPLLTQGLQFNHVCPSVPFLVFICMIFHTPSENWQVWSSSQANFGMAVAWI